MEKVKFYLEGLDDGIVSDGVYVGYDLGGHWNGWRLPTFDKEVTEKLISDCAKLNFFDSYEYDEDSKIYRFYNGKELFEEAQAVTKNGEETYPIGAMSWTWELFNE